MEAVGEGKWRGMVGTEASRTVALALMVSGVSLHGVEVRQAFHLVGAVLGQQVTVVLS